MSSPPTQTQCPPIENFLKAVLNSPPPAWYHDSRVLRLEANRSLLCSDMHRVWWQRLIESNFPNEKTYCPLLPGDLGLLTDPPGDRERCLRRGERDLRERGERLLRRRSRSIELEAKHNAIEKMFDFTNICFYWERNASFICKFVEQASDILK